MRFIATFLLSGLWMSGFTQFNADSLFSTDSIDFLIPTFRGNTERNFYGDGRINRLDLIWKFELGEGITVISRKLGERTWQGAGWTGQPLLIAEGKDTFVIQGAYDHHLRKINALTGKEVWRYKYDDVIKSTGTIWANRNARNREESIVIMQGSRLGIHHYLDTDFVPSYRGISYFTGKELWRLDVEFTDSYSRDVDASSVMFDDTAYIGLENSRFIVFNPDPARASLKDSMLQPEIYEYHDLYTPEDVKKHGGNVVTESSPAILGDRIYLASGSGHVYGYHLRKRKIDWDFYICSDMDGSVVVTRDSCILVSVEKQYIKGEGGVFKLNPEYIGDSAVVWYQPVGDTSYFSWEGGVIGTAGVNDRYITGGQTALAVFTALDGYTYLVAHEEVRKDTLVTGPDGKKQFHPPVLVNKLETGPGIASPIITADRIIVPGYEGLFLYSYLPDGKTELLDRLGVAFEASPVIWGNKLFIAGRNGFFYCLGEK